MKNIGESMGIGDCMGQLPRAPREGHQKRGRGKITQICITKKQMIDFK